ncbi:competence type IV pilus minor pilin ComGF [Streptococcus pneumoniae]
MWKNSKVAAFTLLEALVSLLVISGSILLFQSMTQLLASEIQAQQNNEVKEWLLFADQLDAELSRSQFDKVENGKLYVLQDGKAIAFGKSNKDDFRKTDSNGRGYQPMVYGVTEAQISKDGSIVHIDLRFEKGLERKYIYRVEEKG